MLHRGLFNNCTSATVAFESANGEHNAKKVAQINEPHETFFKNLTRPTLHLH